MNETRATRARIRFPSASASALISGQVVGGALAFILAACADNSKDAQKPSPTLERSSADPTSPQGTAAPQAVETVQDAGAKKHNDHATKLAALQAETELGRAMAGRVVALSKPVADAKLVTYVNEVGTLVARASAYADRRFYFEVLDDPGVNAFACPGGYVFITAGAIRLAEDEAELAAVLGHEIAHVGGQHILQALRGKDFSKEKSQGRDDSALPELHARKRPEPPTSEVGAFLSQQLLGPQAAGLSLFQAVDASLGILLSKGLDQKLEYEADREGSRYSASAGYDPRALARFFERARRAQDPKAQAKNSDAEKTHPKFLDREKAVIAFLTQGEGVPSIGAFGKSRFAKMKALLAPTKESKP